MSADRLYKDGDIVWVRLGNNWWPAEVVDGYRQPTGLLRQVKYEPYCVVKFFEEDQYEIVKRSRQIYPFKCDKKEEFIRKGLALLHVNHDFMKKFPSDVEIAERLTSRVVESDLHVINDRPYSILKAIIGQKLTSVRSDDYNNDFRASSSKMRRSGDSVMKILNIIPARINESASTVNSSTYRCNFCEFTSLRQNVMILHNKTHSSGGNFAPATKTSSEKLPKTSYSDSASSIAEKNKAKKLGRISTPAVTDIIDEAKVAILDTSTNDITASVVMETGQKIPVPLSANTIERAINESPLFTLHRPVSADNVSAAEQFASPLNEDKEVLISKSVSLTHTFSATITDEINYTDISRGDQTKSVNEELDLDQNKQLSTNDDEISELQRDPQDFVRNLEADWSDGEELNATDTVTADVTTNSLITTDKTPAELSDIVEVVIGNEANLRPVATKTFTNLLLPTSSSRIRNIPKKDRRDIILKEFHPRDNNCNSESSASTTPPVVAAIESGSNSNSSELDKGLAVGLSKTVDVGCDDLSQLAEYTGGGMKASSSKEALHANVTLLTETQDVLTSDIVEPNTLETTPVSTNVAIPSPQTSPAVPPRSCFDFEEEEDNDPDVLTSIANFKRKHVSPDKTTSSLNDECTAKQDKTTVTTHESVKIEPKDKQLSDEIESLLLQTKETVIDITTIASTTREDVSVKTLPIKERGKRIFKSRNRSQMEDQPKILIRATKNSSSTIVGEESLLNVTSEDITEDSSMKEESVQDLNKTVQQIEQQEDVIPNSQKKEETSDEINAEMILPKPMDTNNGDVLLPESKNEIWAYKNITEEESYLHKELTESVQNSLNSEEFQAQEIPFVIQASNTVTEIEGDINIEANKIEDCEEGIPNDDEVIPMIRHAPVEIYKEENTNVLQPLGNNDIISLREDRQPKNKAHSKSKEHDPDLLPQFLNTGGYDIQDSKDNNEESLELNICSANNDIETEANISRFTSPTDENSSIGISEAGAEFGSPTSMLDDERLPIIAGNLTDVVRVNENIGEVTIESDVIEKQIEEYASLTDNKANVDSKCLEVLPISVLEDAIALKDECKKVKESIAEKLEDSVGDNSEKSLNKQTDLNDISDIIETEEDIQVKEEEDDEIESPPHEKLSGDEMDEKEDIGKTRSFKKIKDKMATNTKIQKDIVGNFDELENREPPEKNKYKDIGNVTEIKDIEEKGVRIREELEITCNPPQEIKDYTKLEVDINKTKNEETVNNKKDGELFSESNLRNKDEEVRVTESVVIDTDLHKEINNEETSSEKIQISKSSTVREKCIELAMEQNTPITTDERPQEQCIESDSLNSSSVGKFKETISRKRRSHIKITPRKRVAETTRPEPEVENISYETKPKSRKKSEEIYTSNSSSTELLLSKKMEDGQTFENQPHINIATTLTTKPPATNTLIEMRSFRPRRKTNHFETAAVDAKQYPLKITEKLKISTNKYAAPVDTTEVRTPSPLEKVRINVDVANPLSSQIAGILATSSQQQRPGGQIYTEKKVSVSNLPATTTISKSTLPTMKRKKSIEDDIPSFIIERPCMAATSLEKEAFTHVQQKCPQVKITRKEKILDQEGEEEANTLLTSAATSREQVNDKINSTNSIQSPTQMFILNPPLSKQQKLNTDDGSDNNPSATLFDIGNMPILLTNEKLITENMHIIITPTSLANVESQLEPIKQHVEDAASSSALAQTQLMSLGQLKTADDSKIVSQHILQAVKTSEQEEEQNFKSRKISTTARSKRAPARQQSAEKDKSINQKLDLQLQKLTPHQKQLQEQQRLFHDQKQQHISEQKSQTSNQSNKQIGIDSRGNKYVIIKTPPIDLVIQQQQQQQLTLQQLQQHSAVVNESKTSDTFASGTTTGSIVDHPVESVVEGCQEIVGSESQHFKQKSPAAAATGGRKQAGNIITLPGSTTFRQQQFNDAMQRAGGVSSSPGNFSPKRAPVQQQNSSKLGVVGSNTKTQSRSNSSSNRRSKSQQQCVQKQEDPVCHRKLMTKTDQKTIIGSMSSGTAGNRRLSFADSPLPTKMTKKPENQSFDGDVIMAQQQPMQSQTSQPPPLHKLHSKKAKKHQERNTSATKYITAASRQKNTNDSVRLSELTSEASSSGEHQESVHSTTINEEQLMQIHSEDQIDGTSKILAVPTQPIPGYNETFLLCTLVNNNYKPIDNVPLYLDHDLNQLVPVPLEAMDEEPNLIVNHPPPEEIVHQLQTPALVQQTSNATTANGALADALKDVDADSSTQLIYLQPSLEGNETPMTDEIGRGSAIENPADVANDVDETQMAVYIPPECGAELPSDNAVILNIEGQQIILDAATFAHLLANPDANTQLITDDGTEFVLTREVLAALEAQQDTQEESAVEQQQQLEQQMQQAHQIREAGPTDILAVALAGTDLYGSEVLEIETSQGLQLVGADGIVFQSATLPQAHLTPPITAHTSETNALLNQTPIMSTLEKPSTSGKLKTAESSVAGLFAAAVSASDLPNCRPNLDDSLAVIGVTSQSSSSVPTSLELPITVTNPAIAPKSTMAGPTAPVGLSSTSTVAVTEAVQFHCLPHRTGLAPGETRMYNDPGS